MAFIAATLDADGATSDAATVSLSADARTLVAGVTRTAGSSMFDVRLQIGIDDGATRRWHDVATLDSAEAEAVTPANTAAYRFRVETAGTGNTLNCVATL